MTDRNKSILDYNEPTYDASSHLWDLFEQSYYGGERYNKAANIHTHRLESEGDFGRRVQRAYYENRCKRPVDRRVGFLYSSPIKYDPKPPEYLWNSADNYNNSLEEFFKRVTKSATVFGYCPVLIDRPFTDKVDQTVLQEQEDGIRTYLTAYSPRDLLNWEADDKGVFKWVVLRDSGPEGELGLNDQGLPTLNKDMAEYRMVWTPQIWQRYRGVQKNRMDEGIEWTLVGEGINPVGQVPLVSVRIDPDPKSQVVGVSLLNNIAMLNKELLNKQSLKQEILYRQTFPQLVAQGTAEDYLEEGGTDPTLGAGYIVIYPEDMNAPSFIQPDGVSASTLQEDIDSIRNEIAEISGEDPNAINQSMTAESGEAKRRRFMATNAVLKDNGTTLENDFSRILNIVAAWDNTSEVFVVDFPDQFDLDGGQEIQENTKVDLEILGDSTTAKEDIYDGYVGNRYPEMDEARRNQIVKELTEVKEVPELEVLPEVPKLEVIPDGNETDIQDKE